MNATTAIKTVNAIANTKTQGLGSKWPSFLDGFSPG
jgi:hypothetical protein